MLHNSSLPMALFINLLIIALWHFLSYIISGGIGSKYVDYRKFPYRATETEAKGEFYKENFKIDSWYKFLPTKYNTLGTTPNKLKKLDSLELKERLTVVCRSGLCAGLNCLYIICAVILDAPYLAFILGMIVILVNLPFIISARYCRCLILNEIVAKRKALEQQALRAEQTPNVFDLDIL